MNEIETEIINKTNELNKLKSIYNGFPNIKKHINRWKTERFYTKDVNSIVDNCEIRHNCGCCSDSPLEVWPYITINDTRIYSDPCCFTVGEKAGLGEREYWEWQKKLTVAKINPIIIEKIQTYFDANPPQYTID